jgi:hypothetical protein
MREERDITISQIHHKYDQS